MKRFGVLVCVLLIAAPTFALLGGEVDAGRAEPVRAGMTIAGAVLGLGAGTAIALSFSAGAIDTPLSNTLLLTIPVAAAGAAAGTLAGRWMADVALRHQPSPLFAIIEGAGLGLVSGAFVGGITFSLNFAIAFHVLEVPEGFWGRFDYPQAVGMAVLAGGFWGGFFGLLAGAVAIPLVSLVMGF
ncbi:hypothetical protein ACFLTM_03465 [Candidatus Bipolaricaulota bacterium]